MPLVTVLAGDIGLRDDVALHPLPVDVRVQPLDRPEAETR